MDLKSEILKDIITIIPDVDQTKASALVDFLTSEEVGVRSVEMLYDIGLDVIQEKLPRADASKLFRTWQMTYKPERVARRQEGSDHTLSTYAIKWSKVDNTKMEFIRAGKWLPKAERCDLIRAIVKDVVAENPSVQRSFFKTVAQSMVHKYPATFQDRDSQPLKCTYYTQKLQCRFDEVMREKKKRDGTEKPNIPQAYGCVRWRVTTLPQGETRESLFQKKQLMATTYENVSRRDWDWNNINENLTLTFMLQREDINSQTLVPRRRGRGPRQPQPQPKSTETIVEEWPFLFLYKGNLNHFKLLTGVDFEEKLQAFIRDEHELFIKFLCSNLKDSEKYLRRYKRSLRRQDISEDDVHATMILFLLVKVFGDSFSSIVRSIEITTPIEDVEKEAEVPPNPCLVSLGPCNSSRKFYFCVDSKVVSATKSFKEGLSMVFCTYFILNIKYPKEMGNTLDFYQRVVAQITEAGTKIDKKNYRSAMSEKLKTLLDKYTTYKQDQEREEEELDLDEPEPLLQSS